MLVYQRVYTWIGMEYPCLKTFMGYNMLQPFPDTANPVVSLDMPKDQPTGRLSKGHEGLSWRIGWLDPHV